MSKRVQEYNDNKKNSGYDEYNSLTDDWIQHFEETDQLYQHFYKDDLYYINLKYIYVNRENSIEKIKQETFLMSIPNFVSREEVLQILKRSSNETDNIYSLLSILQYNFTLEPSEVKKYIVSSGQERNFMKIVKNIDTIKFEKSISMMNDLNELIFVFYEKSCEFKKDNSRNFTKKIRLRLSAKKKTIKNQYKEYVV